MFGMMDGKHRSRADDKSRTAANKDFCTLKASTQDQAILPCTKKVWPRIHTVSQRPKCNDTCKTQKCVVQTHVQG